MHAIAILALLGAVEAATIPATRGTIIEKRDGVIWKSEDGSGDVEVGVGGGEFNWGTTTIWDAIDSLGAYCSGLSCESEWDVATDLIVGENDLQPTKNSDGIKIKAQGSFEEWARNGLIEILKHTSSLDYRVTKHTYWDPPCDAPASNECTWGAAGDIDQYRGPKRFSIRFHNPANGQQSDITIEAADPEEDETDVCGPLVGAAAGVAGAVSAGLGATVGLLSIFCIGAPGV